MEPEIRHLILCEDVRTDPNNYQRIDALGLITTIHAAPNASLPIVRPLLCTLVLLTGGQGIGDLMVRIFHDRSGRVIFRSRLRPVRFVGNPQAVLGVVFRIRNCSFPMVGLYWVELIFSGTVLSRQKLWLKT